MAARSGPENEGNEEAVRRLETILQRGKQLQVTLQKTKESSRDLSTIESAVGDVVSQCTQLLLQQGKQSTDHGGADIFGGNALSTGSSLKELGHREKSTLDSVENKSPSLWEEVQRAKVYHSEAQQEILEEEKDTMQSVIESLKAQVRSLQHKLFVVEDNSTTRIKKLEKKVEVLENENARLRTLPPH